MSLASRQFCKTLGRKTTKFAASRLFFRIVVGLFIVQAAWLSISSIYPGAFDEDTHLGIIRFFAEHPNPFFAHQPAQLHQFGLVIHDPSYAYRYIMSFPWRLITHLSDNFMVQVVIMRLINVALFATAIVLFRRVLLKAVNNNTVVNLALLFVVLTPNVQQLAAQINYDNMLMALLPLFILLTIELGEQIKNGKIIAWSLGWWVAVSLFTPLVKYTFLTILASGIVYLLWQYYSARRSGNTKLRGQIKYSFKQLSVARQFLLIIVVAASLGLFLERYGQNAIRYHTPLPKCVAVLSVSDCKQNSIYQRGTFYANNKPNTYNTSPILFTYRWLRHMLFNLMMALNGPSSGYAIGLPLPLPYFASIALVSIGIVLCLVFWRKVFKNSAIRLFALITLVYCATLWALNYSNYLSTGRRVAVQGRYLIPLLPMIYLMILLAFRQLLQKRLKLQHTVASLAIFCFLAGGGALTFILHSDASWYWPNKSIVQLNVNTQHLLKPVIPGSHYAPYWQGDLEF